MTKKQFLKVLPKFNNESIIVSPDQDIDDIVAEVIKSHEIFSNDYDTIISVFRMPDDLYQWLFDFCKQNIAYEIESEDLQTVRSPAGILQMGAGDCKHYASFIGGILAALQRDGYAINWCFRFADYRGAIGSHVFIVVKDDGQEIWIDPVLDRFDSRYPSPVTFFDRKIKSNMLTRISGIPGEQAADPADAFASVTSISRDDYNANGAATIGLVQPMGKDAYSSGYDINENFYDNGDSGGGGFVISDTPIIQQPPVVYPKALDTIQYLVNGQPLVFPAKGSRATIPADLVIVFPQTWQGKAVPVDLPKPVVAGNRLVLLPKIAWNVRDQYAAYDYLFVKLIRTALTPLIQAYGQFPDWNQENLYFTIWDDTDRADVVDYITSKPVAMSFDWEVLPEITYFMNDVELKFPPDRNFNGVDYNKNNPPPKIADNLAVVYPDFYKGVAVPDDLPRPVMNNGKLQLQPHGFGVDKMRANYFMWHSFLVAVMTPLIRSFAQYPYTGNNDLTERIWNDIAKNQHLEDYLVAPDRKTFLGEVIEKLAGYVQEVTRLSLKVINAGSRLAFLGLVRINAFAFAYKLFLSLNNPEKKDKLLTLWRRLGGNTGDFQKAIILGCKNNPVFGGGVKQWIEDAVQDGVIDNGYTRPAGDSAIADEYKMSGTMGIAVADDVVYYMAAASAIIAALGGFLKGIGGEETDKVVDNIIAGYDVLAAFAGTDPIGAGAGVGAPTQIIDPATGQVHTIQPPITSNQNPVLAFIKSNPIPTALLATGVAGGVYLLMDKNKKGRTTAKA